MPDTNGHEEVEKAGRPAYDVRLAALEARTAGVETDVAVIRASFATKDDIQLLRSEMHAGHERILTLLYEHKLEMQNAMAVQREDFRAALATQREDFYAALAKHHEEFSAALGKQREEFNAALAKQHEEFSAALSKQREEFNAALAKQHEEFNAALSKQREEFNAALGKQREEFNAALGKQREDVGAMHLQLQKELTSHLWKLYGFASLLLGGVYFIARYVH